MKKIKTLLVLLLIFSLLACNINNKNQPNIIIILTDDMDSKLMPYMPKTNQLIGEQGATFTNYFITTPICCPSRASMLRGQYAHNTDILENTPGFTRFFKLEEEKDALPVWLNNAGYQTALIGKYLNNYPTNAGRNYVPPGWSLWNVFQYGNHYYYDYTMNENGKLVEYQNAETDYSTDVIKEKSLRFIDANLTNASPFFLLVSVYAPHGPSIPALRHSALMNNLKYPQSPSFNETDISDKPTVIQALSQTGDEFDEGDANYLFQKRAQSLQAVDELVEEIIQTLEVNNALDNTYIIFTSDNGFHMGEHGIPAGKALAYEEDIKVPFLIRGPDITPNSTVNQMTANIDLAPSIAELANVNTPDFVDGRSFVSLLQNEKDVWRNSLLIEFGYIRDEANATQQPPSSPQNEANNIKFRAIRFEHHIYIEYENGEKEFYDLIQDPYQLENKVSNLNHDTVNWLQEQLQILQFCVAKECRYAEDELTFEMR
ncbi:MAG TPA: sulfatase [Anaerolineales bacterium]|nr:sulfatase [Anaerolineales bacterium]